MAGSRKIVWVTPKLLVKLKKLRKGNEPIYDVIQRCIDAYEERELLASEVAKKVWKEAFTTAELKKMREYQMKKKKEK
jgi:hypothetical protein